MSALIVQADGQEPAMFTQAFTVGRSGARSFTADVTLPDEYVTDWHATFVPEGSGWAVEDMASTNGTWLNGKRVWKARVAGGNRIRVGRTTLTVVPMD